MNGDQLNEIRIQLHYRMLLRKSTCIIVIMSVETASSLNLKTMQT